MTLTRRAACVVVLACPVLAGAAPRVVLGPIKGDKGSVVSRQVAKELCARLECAPKASAYAGTRPDFARARRQGVAGILYGAITESGARRMMWYALLTTSTEPVKTWKLPLRPTGQLAPAAVAQIADDVERRLAPPAPAPRAAAPPPAAGPPRTAPERAPALVEERPTRAGASEGAPAAAPPGPSAPPAPPPPRPERVAAAVPRPTPAAVPSPRAAAAPGGGPARERPTWAAVELGGYVTARNLSFSGTQPAGTSTLQTMTADAVFCPRLALELYPAARLTDGALAGLGAFADYRMSIGFKVRSAGQTYGTSLSRLGAGVTWRLPPLTSLKLVLAPAASYERRDVNVSGTIAGLADTHLAGVRLGARLSAPVTSRFQLLVGGGYVRWTSVGDLAKSGGGFFPSGKASAFELEAGLSMALYGPFSARLVGEYGSTSYTLDADPTGAYVASGATDRWSGATLSIRAEL
jgi:hypothetical protein